MVIGLFGSTGMGNNQLPVAWIRTSQYRVQSDFMSVFLGTADAGGYYILLIDWTTVSERGSLTSDIPARSAHI
jgi:hypothetical protein